ncbi:DsbA family protein, partial [Patescibacteria group bacterium]|nr:DsbA family protein [Patescibacteria group bacterium]
MQTTQTIKWYKKWWGISLIIIFILFLMFGIYFIYLVRKIQKEMQINELNPQTLLTPSSVYEKSKNKILIEGQNNYWTGSIDPKIVIVEFADFSCPLCKNSFSKIRTISLKYKDNIKIIFRDFPIHENSINLALAGRCAGEQGLFWQMHDKLFQSQGDLTSDHLVSLATQIGVDAKKFNDCLNSQKYLTSIKKDFYDGELLGVKGTPTWFINGQKIEGDISFLNYQLS